MLLYANLYNLTAVYHPTFKGIDGSLAQASGSEP